jgi:MFS transporter, AAHS family, 4-hydroxybenzoate transporter
VAGALGRGGFQVRPVAAAVSSSLPGQVFDVSAFLDRPQLGGVRLVIVALCAAVMLIDGYDVFLVGYMLPALASEFGASVPAITWVLVIQTSALAIGACAVSPFADHYGRRNLILICVTLFGVFTLWASAARSIGEMAVLRFCASLFFGGVIPNVVAMTSEYSPRSRCPMMVMLLFAAFTVGAGGSGFLVSLLLSGYGWRSALWIGGIAPLLLVPLLFFRLPESIRFLVLNERNAQVAGILRHIDPEVAIDGSTRFTIHEVRTGAIPTLALFRDGRAATTALLTIASSANLFAIAITGAWLATFMHVFAGFEPSTAAGVAALSSVGGVGSPFLLAPLIDRFGAPRVLSLAYLMGGLASVLIGLAAAVPLLASAAVFWAGFFLIGGQAGLNALAAAAYPTEMRVTGIGWALGTGRFASVFGPALGGFMLAAHWPPLAIFSMIAAPAFVASAATIFIPHPRPMARATTAVASPGSR